MSRSPAQVVDEVLALVLGGLGHLEGSKKGPPGANECPKDLAQLEERIQLLEKKVAHLEARLSNSINCEL